ASEPVAAWKDATGTELHKLILNYQKEDMIASGGRQAERAANYSTPLYASPQPANPAQVTDALTDALDVLEAHFERPLREWEITAFHAALTAAIAAECEGLRAALESIISSETDYANATVKRIIRIARAALAGKE